MTVEQLIKIDAAVAAFKEATRLSKQAEVNFEEANELRHSSLKEKNRLGEVFYTAVESLLKTDDVEVKVTNGVTTEEICKCFTVCPGKH